MRNFDHGAFIFGTSTFLLVMIYVIINVRRLYLSDDQLKTAIIKYYENKGLVVNEISKLNLPERMKYGVPILSIFRLYSYFYGMMIGTIDYTRKVDIIDKDKVEHITFLELIVKKREIISFKEFASYEI